MEMPKLPEGYYWSVETYKPLGADTIHVYIKKKRAFLWDATLYRAGYLVHKESTVEELVLKGMMHCLEQMQYNQRNVKAELKEILKGSE
jgi:hypothetical protein